MLIQIAAIVTAIVVGLLVAKKAKQIRSDDGFDFASRDVLFTPAERSFLGVLEQALGRRYRVFGKVRLGDVVKPAKGLSNSKRVAAQKKANRKHVDFLICSAADMAVVGVVELDDQSHGREVRAGRDRFVVLALAMAGIPIFRFTTKKGYALQEVRAGLAEILTSATRPDFATDAQDAISTVQPDPAAPSCPKCGAIMVKRQTSKGKNEVKWFWACSVFPKCRQVAIGES